MPRERSQASVCVMFWETVLEQDPELRPSRRQGVREKLSPGRAARLLLPGGLASDRRQPSLQTDPRQVGADLWFLEVAGSVEKHGLRPRKALPGCPAFRFNPSGKATPGPDWCH